MKTVQKSTIILGYYVLIVAYWAALFVTHTKSSQINYLYQFAFSLVPFLGGLAGLVNAQRWGGFKSRLGRALSFLSLGTIVWGLGQLAWSYYVIFAGNTIPFPSWADLGFSLALPLWAYGIVNLAQATGAMYGLRKSVKRKVISVILPVVTTVISYYVLIVWARGGTLVPAGENPIKIILDIAYPLGDVIILTFALLTVGLSSGYLGGRYRPAIYIILSGFAVQYLADTGFSYTTTKGTYYNGHWVDLLFPTAMALITFGLCKMKPIISKAPEQTATEAVG